MASLTYVNKRATVQFVGQDGKRRSIRFGQCDRRQAETAKYYVEALVTCKSTGSSMNGITAEWVAGLPAIIRKRVESAGLIEPQERKEYLTLAMWIDNYISNRTDTKPATLTKFDQARKKLSDFFGPRKQLAEVNASDADDFVIYLKKKGLSEGTVRRLSGISKQFFAKAKKKRLISENPFDGIKCASFCDPTKRYFITPMDAQAILNECPDREWRLIFALCRYGALRCPSEVFRLTWADIDWAKDRFTVHACKTEHHDGGGIRIVPIFPELLPYLQECFDHAEAGSEYVITRYRDPKQNLRTQFERIILKAGLTPWPKLFVNLRSTRVTELNETFPGHVVAAWAGHSEAVERKHYLQTTEAHFQKAVQNPVQRVPELPRSNQHTDSDEYGEMAFCGSMLDDSNCCNGNEIETMGPVGLEPTTR